MTSSSRVSYTWKCVLTLARYGGMLLFSMRLSVSHECNVEPYMPLLRPHVPTWVYGLGSEGPEASWLCWRLAWLLRHPSKTHDKILIPGPSFTALALVQRTSC